MKSYLAIIGLVFLSITACNNSSVVDDFQEVDPEGWSYTDTVHTTFEIVDTTHYYQLFSNMRVSGDFTMTNMQIKLIIEKPNGDSKEHEISVKLADKSGKWLGSGLGDIITFQQPILALQEFNQKGEYTVHIIQNMREDLWPHVHAVGIKVDKDKEIF
ncbi:gliding motility lipoprotein GldH [bacterium]|nr:gliding motility lipoprotein GldH [bacterium]